MIVMLKKYFWSSYALRYNGSSLKKNTRLKNSPKKNKIKMLHCKKEKKTKNMYNLRASHIKCNKVFPSRGLRLVTMFGRTLWKGPRICSPAYDLKLRLTKCVIMRRGAPGSLVIAGGGGGGMLLRISSKLRLSSTSAASPWDASVARTHTRTHADTRTQREKHNLFFSFSFLFFFF